VADRFHVVKNLTEALQLCLSRGLEEIKAAGQPPEPSQNGPSKQVVSVEEWRPLEPAHVEKARLARRSGRYGRYQQVVQTRKQAEVKASANPQRIQKYAPNAALWLFVRDQESLDEVGREERAAFCQASTTLKKASDLVQDFLSMVQKREGYRLDRWLEQVESSDLCELHSFATGVGRDKAAVQAGLTWWINNGVVEGSVTKVKLIKRQMYGRAGFALLRQRVLHAL